MIKSTVIQIVIMSPRGKEASTSTHIMSCDKEAYLLFSDSFDPDSG